MLIRWVFVEDEARGHGYAKTMLNEALEFCKRVSVERIHLYTHEHLRAAIHLYKQAGFKRFGQVLLDMGNTVVTLEHYEVFVSQRRLRHIA